MKAIVNVLNKINKAWMSVAGAAMNVALLVILVLFGILIFMREVMHVQFFGQEEIVVTISVWIYFIGAAFGTYDDVHVSGDLIKTMMKTRRAKAIQRLYLSGVSTLISLYYLRLDINWMKFQMKLNPLTDALRFPKMYMYSASFVGFVFITIYFFMHFGKALYVLITNNETKEIHD